MRSLLLLGAGLRGLRGGLRLTGRPLAFRIPTVLLNIPATDSYMGLVEAIFMFCVGRLGGSGTLPAGQAPGGPWRPCRNRIRLLGTVAICRRLLQRQALYCSAGQEPSPNTPAQAVNTPESTTNHQTDSQQVDKRCRDTNFLAEHVPYNCRFRGMRIGAAPVLVMNTFTLKEYEALLTPNQ